MTADTTPIVRNCGTIGSRIFETSVRLSFSLYNQPEELDLFFEALNQILHAGRQS